jgi:hypothetical protein
VVRSGRVVSDSDTDVGGSAAAAASPALAAAAHTAPAPAASADLSGASLAADATNSEYVRTVCHSCN